MLLSQRYDLLGQLSFDTQDGAGLSCFVLIFGQADLLSFAFLFSQKEVWLGRLGAKFFEMNGTDSDRILVLHSVLFFFFFLNVIQYLKMYNTDPFNASIEQVG